MGAKTLFIGLDGASADLIDELIDMDAMPNLAALARKMARRTVENEPGFGDGVYWTSTATGVDTATHGIYYILQHDPQTYENYWIDEGKHVGAPAFWAALDDLGKKTFIIDWPHAPFGPLNHGVHLDGWLQHDAPLPGRSHPPEAMADAIARFTSDPYLPGLHIHPIETADKAIWLLEKGRERIDAKARYSAERMNAEDWDMFAVVFSEAHDIGHNGYHLVDAENPYFDAEMSAAVGENPMHVVMRAKDEAIGRLIEAAGENANVVVMAGLGMRTLVTASHQIDLIAERLDRGLEAEETPVAQARKSYRSMIPLPVRSALSPIKRLLFREKSRSPLATRRFFPLLHVDNAACIRVNLKGREKCGVIEPGAEYEALLQEIEAGFREICDAETGESIVADVFRASDHYAGPRFDELPDLFIIWNRDRFFKTIESPKIGRIDLPRREVRTGDHVETGDLWASEDDIREAGIGNSCRPADVTRLVLNSVLRTESAESIPVPG